MSRSVRAGRLRLERRPVERVQLAVGDRLKFREERMRYEVRAVSADGRWAICTKPMNAHSTVLYTIIDFDSGVRGPDNRTFSRGYETDEQVAANLADLEAGVLEVSVRRDLVLDIEQHVRASS